MKIKKSKDGLVRFTAKKKLSKIKGFLAHLYDFLNGIKGKIKLKTCLIGGIIALLSMLGGFLVGHDSDPEIIQLPQDRIYHEVHNDEATIELAPEIVPAIVEIDGYTEEVQLHTIEAIDGGLVEECPADRDCGRGWFVPTNTPQAFRDATNGLCVDTDGFFGSQCWDLGDLFWRNYAGRGLNTCGSGAAAGTIRDGCWQLNAGREFTMVWSRHDIRVGDWVVTNTGTWGHVCMAVGSYNNGFVACFGTNQGGTPCQGGGAVANTINLSLRDFAGAFRPRSWWIDPPDTGRRL